MVAQQKYVFWKDEDMWIGYLEEFPDYWTEAETQIELNDALFADFSQSFDG